METLNSQLIEYGVAKFILPGEGESGDEYLISSNQNGILVAVVDGIGHGTIAANAARTVISMLRAGVNSPIISLVERCHETLRSTRGLEPSFD